MKVECPTCKSAVEWSQESKHRPFCSKRCQLIDLGQWANEENAIACGSQSDDRLSSNIDVEDIEAMLRDQNNEFFKPN